ncbi:ankyrin repeat domain-containing protein [Amycolatopsis sp. GM8]|uniref:ankyrin repeat domain-containing protein n=1 Tax=Amycolatopsis sp. GM8 TaxID=2896530 RepID=UPI001F26F694|nr:ankyrin repeat domain-containing protein [Amycolatopsis sp. GM8]
MSEKLAEYRVVDAIQQLGYAAETGDVERVGRLLREGVPVDARNPVGRPRTALDRAIWAEQTDVVRLLLASGADPEQPIGEYGENTPVRFAAPRGMTDILRLLLEAGADPDGRGGARERAPGSQLAAVQGLAAIVEMLLDHGASINHVEGYRGTPLAGAAAGGWPVIVRMLLDRGAIPTTEALELAERNSARYRTDPERLAGFAQVIAILKAAGA